MLGWITVWAVGLRGLCGATRCQKSGHVSRTNDRDSASSCKTSQKVKARTTRPRTGEGERHSPAPTFKDPCPFKGQTGLAKGLPFDV